LAVAAAVLEVIPQTILKARAGLLIVLAVAGVAQQSLRAARVSMVDSPAAAAALVAVLAGREVMVLTGLSAFGLFGRCDHDNN
jgi:hypothetical protein